LFDFKSLELNVNTPFHTTSINLKSTNFLTENTEYDIKLQICKENVDHKSKAGHNLLFAEKQFYDTKPSIQPLSTLDVPKNFDRRTGPPPSSLSVPESLLFDLCFFSFFDRLDLDFDLFDDLSSSSLLEEYEDDEEELDGEDLLECCNGKR